MKHQEFISKGTTILLAVLLFVISISDSYGQSRKLRKIQKSINKATAGHLVGVAVYIKSSEGNEWIGVSGFQDKESRKPIEAGSIFATGSIGKMYNAVATLKLVEQGILQLDGKIGEYLPEWIISNLPNGEIITVRHLLSNQSGLFNYENDPKLNQLYLSGNLKLDTLTHENVLRRYVFNHPATDFPGTKYRYSSTNFMLLAMIMDHVTLQGHTNYLRKEILQINGFKNTYYRETPPNKLVNHYGDLDKDGNVEDLTMETIETTNWFIGDDGIYAPIKEAAHFLETIMSGGILKKETLEQMTKWNDEQKPDYGLGLMADKSFPYKFLIGHSGRGIGTTTDLFYFPNQKMTVGIFCNTGIRQTSPMIKKEYLRMRTKIVKTLFLF
ncbi:D-alanyl-D-alanine carboxypeptidase [Mariniradius saccharolyticus AK6]|uniref:D-alanyl-D-alanine carboxypeptidase n=1 Tax=Mariniradius saccharolyticus AK6 TaxID=1239962 RepID=M7Y6H6_9BACT|nr:serine hydrolase domain-containing protein [Mariniradius saccharolyticus]EMS32831.1 D-alanyl-D-alanine carboxypeptidase [Mariniradius saccharolyticus AK6]